jgi:hypothetical protein
MKTRLDAGRRAVRYDILLKEKVGARGAPTELERIA